MTDSPTYRYVNDTATLVDGFGTTTAGDEVARMALEAEAPFTLGITGKWGAGKTSVLRRAFVTLKGRPVTESAPLKELNEAEAADWEHWHYDAKGRRPRLRWGRQLPQIARRSLAVWYSPWQHQGADNPVVPLLLEIQSQFTTRMKLRDKLEDAIDWFREQSEDPDLVRRRGQRPGEPLPRDLGLFGDKGLPLPVQTRSSWQALRAWLDDDEAILAFVFPEGLDAADRQLLLDDLAILREQPWSPQEGVDAVLADWPKDEEERVITLEAAEERVLGAAQEAWAAIEAE